VIEHILVVLIGSYLVGSIPVGYIVGRVRGVDVREYGSGKMGMTNVLRTLGGKAAIVVLLGDVCKGGIAVFLSSLISDSPEVEAIAGVAVITGHIWPVFLRLRGGRGIATGLGTLFLIFPMTSLIVLAIFIVVVSISRYVSLGSIGAASAVIIAVPVTAIVAGSPNVHVVYGILGAALILIQHSDNMKRILKGTERRLGQPADSSPPKCAEAR
jgi:glycerol-3-phosphate acyltransferase PlsY